MSVGFGARARVGQLYPSGGLCDYELQLMAPEGVQVLTTRMPFLGTRVADDLALVEDLERHAQLLADPQVDLIAFNCTAASMLIGSAEVSRRIHAATGLPSVTTIGAVEAALDLLGARRVALLTPYPDEVVAREVEHLAGLGVETVVSAGPSCATPVEQGSIPPEEWLRLAGTLDTTDVDVVLLSCAGTRTAEVLDAIEQTCGRALVTSNQSLLRLVLVRLGIEPVSPGYGHLLSPAALPAPDRKVT